MSEVNIPDYHIPNHYTAALSELDIMMVRSVPPGGNWKDIPTSIPSKRLEQIRRSYTAGGGSRSTYYGRLHPQRPAYTINTHFNRPGNGCHIHYDYAGGQHRMISQREAARLQSFPDSFAFLGSRSGVNKQIGNAVPPLVAFQLAQGFGSQGLFADLFCGAGGLSLGFQWAKWKPIVAIDSDAAAVATYRANVGACAILGDVRNRATMEQVASAIRKARTEHPDQAMVVLGGPPCQGFSTAGNRRCLSDDRNQLFKLYREVLIGVQPDGFVFENVPGILSMEGGEVFRKVVLALSLPGYRVEVLKLSAERYGVPQRRLRVFVVGSGHCASAFNRPRQITAFAPSVMFGGAGRSAVSVLEALGDLPPLEPGQDGSRLRYLRPPSCPYQEFARGILSAPELTLRLSRETDSDRSN